jgi:hypothetical protein
LEEVSIGTCWNNRFELFCGIYFVWWNVNMMNKIVIQSFCFLYVILSNNLCVHAYDCCLGFVIFLLSLETTSSCFNDHNYLVKEKSKCIFYKVRTFMILYDICVQVILLDALSLVKIGLISLFHNIQFLWFW